jgi:hypothetical protein
MFSYIIRSYNNWVNFERLGTSDTQNVTFNNVDANINVYKLPRSIKYIEFYDSPNVRFHGTRLDYPTIEIMLITQRPSTILNVPDFSLTT